MEYVIGLVLVLLAGISGWYRGVRSNWGERVESSEEYKRLKKELSEMNNDIDELRRRSQEDFLNMNETLDSLLNKVGKSELKQD